MRSFVFSKQRETTVEDKTKVCSIKGYLRAMWKRGPQQPQTSNRSAWYAPPGSTLYRLSLFAVSHQRREHPCNGRVFSEKAGRDLKLRNSKILHGICGDCRDFYSNAVAHEDTCKLRLASGEKLPTVPVGSTANNPIPQWTKCTRKLEID